MNYTLGLLFDFEKENILLILKNRPQRQAGLYNALGGKIEGNETPLQNIIREVEEEAGLRESWQHFLTLRGSELDGSEWNMYVFKAFSYPHMATQGEDQPVAVFPINNLPKNIMPNLHWMIPMALNVENEYLDYFEVNERFHA